MRPLLLLAVLAAGLGPGLVAAADGGGWVRAETNLMPGVTRIDLRRESPPCDVRMVAFDRAALPDPSFHVREAGGGLFATRSVPDLARELESALAPSGAHRAVAGVNGDFFDNGSSSPSYGSPMGLVVSGRELLTTGLLVPGILYAQPQTMLYEWRDRAGRRELRVGRLVFRGEILSGGENGATVTNGFRLVNPLLQNLDPDPAKQPAELAVLTARWTKPLPAPGVRVRYAPSPRKERPTGLFAPYRGCGGVEILGPAKKGDRLSGDPLEGAIVGFGAAAGTATALLAERRPDGGRPPPKAFGGAYDLFLSGDFERDPGIGEDFFEVEEAVRPWTLPMRGGTISDTHEVSGYPRTLVGLGPDRIVLFVADGRSSRSKSMTSREAAGLLAAEGCTDAVQFDGGGSATLLAGGAVLNRPSDGRPRKVANGLFLTIPAR